MILPTVFEKVVVEPDLFAEGSRQGLTSCLYARVLRRGAWD